jgi:hypothetical protein
VELWDKVDSRSLIWGDSEILSNMTVRQYGYDRLVS